MNHSNNPNQKDCAPTPINPANTVETAPAKPPVTSPGDVEPTKPGPIVAAPSVTPPPKGDNAV